MKSYNIYLLIIFALGAYVSARAQMAFVGSDKQVVNVKVEAVTGLDDVFVVFDTQGVTAQYTGQTSDAHWQRYSALGGGYAEDIACQRDGNTSSVALGHDDMGYIITDGDRRYYCWVVNYANHYADLDGLSLDSEQDCDRARLTLIGSAPRISYYTINGQSKELSRELTIDYNTLMYDEESHYYRQIGVTATIASAEGTISVVAPLCDTHFTIAGDRFLQAWGLGQQAESPLYDAVAVEAQTEAEQLVRDNLNEQKVDGGALGGSAPVEVTFTAEVTDKAVFREWQMSKNPDFEPIDDRYADLTFEYAFADNGTTFVRFVANNAAGSCEYVSETYEVFVGESVLLCPNAFSPYGSEGVNDEWRVSYKSIVKFECSIFNRWGQLMTSFTDPGQGWDGKYQGKLVPPGVYFYVIKAVGSDGRRYNLDGDINIINSKANPYAPSEE